MSNPIHVFSEIGRLKKVCLHRPGKELENLMPDYLERLLFDDIPYLEDAQKEHDAFAETLRNAGVEVLYLEQLAAEAIDAAGVREEFVDEWLAEAGVASVASQKAIKDHLLSLPTFDLVLKTMEGFRKTEVQAEATTLAGMYETDYPFVVDPMPNLYFTRDPFATMANGVSLNHMYADTRNRETIYGKYIFTYHPVYGNGKVPFFYDRTEDTRIEGGDELVLSKEVLAVGISQRTDARSIEKIAQKLFAETDFKQVLAFVIGENRKFMHLDTVFTHIDYDKFTIHPEIQGGLKVFSITKGENGALNIELTEDKLENVLAKALGLPSVTLIPCGGGDPVEAAREQWNDGSNTLTIAPGEVVVYDRNVVTNAILEKYGIKLHKIRGSELVRGRGGPRCMSMPFERENL